MSAANKKVQALTSAVKSINANYQLQTLERLASLVRITDKAVQKALRVERKSEVVPVRQDAWAKVQEAVEPIKEAQRLALTSGGSDASLFDVMDLKVTEKRIAKTRKEIHAKRDAELKEIDERYEADGRALWNAFYAVVSDDGQNRSQLTLDIEKFLAEKARIEEGE